MISLVLQMSPDGHTVRRSQGDFASSLQADIDAIRPGQCHCYLHLAATLSPVGQTTAQIIADALVEMVPEHLPEEAMICELSDSDCGIWLPRHSKEDATTIARFLRYSITNRLLGRTDQPVTGTWDENRACALGIVVIKQSNWTADALLRTGQITAATARLTESNGIRIADQINGKFGS